MRVREQSCSLLKQPCFPYASMVIFYYISSMIFCSTLSLVKYALLIKNHFGCSVLELVIGFFGDYKCL